MSIVNAVAAAEFVEKQWHAGIEETLKQYIAVPNQSPAFDKQWETNGHVDKALDLLVNWAKAQNIPTLELQVLREPGRTPLIFITVDGDAKTQDTVLMYGHMDKQPPMTADWESGLGPWTPVIRDGKLYGRGGADDGYSIFAALTAIRVLKEQNLPHARCVIIIEACEESGSIDLPHYINKLTPQIGEPSLVICLDSGCANYEQLWLTNSLRGLFVATLRVTIVKEGVHSGSASGIVPSSFRILRNLLDRLEDSKTGEVLPRCFWGEITPTDEKYASQVADIVGKTVITKFPFVAGAQPVTTDVKQALLNSTLRPTVSYIGIDGFPADMGNAGNVLRPSSAVKLSIRLPPNVDPVKNKIEDTLRELLTKDVPYGASVELIAEKCGKGWQAPVLDSWLDDSLNTASTTYFKKPYAAQGEGGSIPFMGMLGAKFPKTQFVITGVLGPGSNAHGPNEFLHIDFTKKIICIVANVLADHYQHTQSNKKQKQ